MGIRSRTVLLLFGTALVLWAVLQTAGVIIGDHGANQIDRNVASEDVARAISTVSYDEQQLAGTAEDWAVWDDSYRFVRDHNRDFITTNLTDATLAELRVDFMVFLDRSGTVVYSKAIDPSTGHAAAFPTDVGALVRARSLALRASGPVSGRTAVLWLSSGRAALISQQPIEPSAGGPATDGTLLVGYAISPHRVAQIQQRTRLSISLFPITGAGVPRDVAAAATSLRRGSSTTVAMLDSKADAGYGTLPGLGGEPSVVLRVAEPRTAFTLTRGIVLSAGAALGVFGLILVGLLGLTLDMFVLPDHMRASQSQRILEIASRSTAYLRDGLDTESAAQVCALILERSPADAVVLTDTHRVLGYAGLGADHHAVGGPIVMSATERALRLNQRQILRTREAIGCPEPSCPLTAAILIPLQIGGCAGGNLELFFTSARKLDRTTIALAEGLEPLISMQLELDRSRGELEYLAAHDPLTHLANRRQFEAELERELAEQRRLGGGGAILWFDIDHFKDVNDSLGHAAGDALLVAFAKEVRDHSRDYCTLARVGGDEFGMLVPHADEAEAKAAASRLLSLLSETAFSVAGHEVRVSASIGVVRYPEHGSVCDELMARADLAMYEAKATGGNRFVAYALDDLWRSRMTEQIDTADRILRALREGRLALWAQPLREIGGGPVDAYELLLRMVGEDGEIIMPAQFIPTAERLGIIRDIDRWVAREAIHLLAQEQAAGRPTVFGVNLSGCAFSDPELLDIMRAEFLAHGTSPGRLVVEITETIAIADMARAQEFIGALKEIGCRFSLDDFGSGSSSFYYLKHLPIDYLKIDGALIKGLNSSSPDTHFVRAIIEMCKGLGIRTVAEWVEDADLLEAVSGLGADFAQGYEVGRPCPVGIYLTPPEEPMPAQPDAEPGSLPPYDMRAVG